MNQYSLSVVIPIYNAEKYLENIITALINQTIFINMEILLVNDGSTDKSSEICQKYATIYSNVKYEFQENKGVSSARNLGISKCTGTYIAFADADDSIDSDLYEKMLKLIASAKTDMAIVNFDMVHPDGTSKKHRKPYQKILHGKDSLYKNFFSGNLGNNVVDKIFKTDIVKKVQFPVGYQIGEDMYFVFSCIKHVNTAIFDTNICGYHYLIRSGSAMTSNFSKKYFDPVRLSEFMLNEMIDSPLTYYAEAHLIHEKCKLLENMHKNNAGGEFESTRQNTLNDVKQYSLCKAQRYLIKRQFLGFLLMKLSPHLYMFAHRLLKIG